MRFHESSSILNWTIPAAYHSCSTDSKLCLQCHYQLIPSGCSTNSGNTNVFSNNPIFFFIFFILFYFFFWCLHCGVLLCCSYFSNETCFSVPPTPRLLIETKSNSNKIQLLETICTPPSNSSFYIHVQFEDRWNLATTSRHGIEIVFKQSIGLHFYSIQSLFETVKPPFHVYTKIPFWLLI